MSVTALSTAPVASPISAAATPASGAAAANDAQPFAKLIEQPAADGRAPGQDAKPPAEIENETKTSTDVVADDQQDIEQTGTESLIDSGTDFLADMEAMLAAASQLIVVPMAYAPTPAAPAIVSAPPTADIRAVSTTAMAIATLAPAKATTNATAPAPAPDAGGDRPVAETAAPIAVSTDDVIEKPTAQPIAQPAPQPVLAGGKDIASLIAALRSSLDTQHRDAAALPNADMQRGGPADPIVGPDSTSEAIPVPLPAADSVTGATAPVPASKPQAIEALPATEVSMPALAAPASAVVANTDAPATVSAAPQVAEAIVSGATRPITPDAVIAEQNIKPSPAVAAPVPADVPIVETDGATPVPVAASMSALAVASSITRATPAAAAPVARDEAVPVRSGNAPARDAAPAISTDTPVAGPRAEDGPLIDRDDLARAVTTDPLPAAPATTASTDGIALDGTAPTATSTLAEQTVDRHLDLARESQWLDRLARDIGQAASHQGSLKFQLNPQHLGSLQIEIANSAAGTSIRMTTDREEARDIIADAQPRLIAEVRAQGVRVAEAHVDLDNQQQPSNGQPGQMAGGQASAQQQQQQRRSSEDHKPFSFTPPNQRDLPSDSVSRNDGELYA